MNAVLLVAAAAAVAVVAAVVVVVAAADGEHQTALVLYGPINHTETSTASQTNETEEPASRCPETDESDPPANARGNEMLVAAAVAAAAAGSGSTGSTTHAPVSDARAANAPTPPGLEPARADATTPAHHDSSAVVCEKHDQTPSAAVVAAAVGDAATANHGPAAPDANENGNTDAEAAAAAELAPQSIVAGTIPNHAAALQTHCLGPAAPPQHGMTMMNAAAARQHPQSSHHAETYRDPLHDPPAASAAVLAVVVVVVVHQHRQNPYPQQHHQHQQHHHQRRFQPQPSPCPSTTSLDPKHDQKPMMISTSTSISTLVSISTSPSTSTCPSPLSMLDHYHYRYYLLLLLLLLLMKMKEWKTSHQIHGILQHSV